ncbi:MAG: triphosphoribosyl-dephospho-CoA synthase [Halobacteriota archaeon]
MYDIDFIAGSAELAMLLEVSATPKPGNVDRTHDFEDLTYEHFLGSAVGMFPVFRKAASEGHNIGDLILNAVKASALWQKAGNCHFGAILLLIPLCAAASRSSTIAQLRRNAANMVRSTTTTDAVRFYESFRSVNVHVKERHYLDINDPESVRTILKQQLTLFNIMEISSSNDTIAKEWIEGFPRIFHGAELFRQFDESRHNLNKTIVCLFLRLLSAEPDTLVAKKFDSEVAFEVSAKASHVLEHGNIEDFDAELITRRINPGTTADLVIGSLFVSLLRGYRF